ncbi:MAG: hypothetical protein SOI66_05345 [Bifidobacterium sp.]|jgi:hypothetical protein
MDMNVLIVITGILTALFTGIAVVQHVIERPKPRIELRVKWKRIDAENSLVCSVMAINVGNGSAYNARITATSGESESRDFTRRLTNDNEIEWFAEVPVVAPAPHADLETGAYKDEWRKPIPDKNVFVFVTWNQPPYFFWTHRKKIRLNEIEEA